MTHDKIGARIRPIRISNALRGFRPRGICHLSFVICHATHYDAYNNPIIYQYRHATRLRGARRLRAKCSISGCTSIQCHTRIQEQIGTASASTDHHYIQAWTFLSRNRQTRGSGWKDKSASPERNRTLSGNSRALRLLVSDASRERSRWHPSWRGAALRFGSSIRWQQAAPGNVSTRRSSFGRLLAFMDPRIASARRRSIVTSSVSPESQTIPLPSPVLVRSR
jgi:hypothetical protein